MSNKSFVDLLFILLCGTIVMLSRSIQVGAVDTAPARVGGGGLSEVCADEIRLVAVSDRRYEWTDVDGGLRRADGADEVAAAMDADDCVLLVAGNEGVSHHRVMEAWSAFRKAGCRVKLGAVPADGEETGGS